MTALLTICMTDVAQDQATINPGILAGAKIVSGDMTEEDPLTVVLIIVETMTADMEDTIENTGVMTTDEISDDET